MTIQESMMDGEEGTTKYAKGAKREAKLLFEGESYTIIEIYVREVIERGLEDSKAGRTKDVNEVRKKYGLPA